MELNSHFEEQGQYSLCLQYREKMPDLVEGYLDAMTAEAIRAHLSVCALCNTIYQEMEHTIRMVETLPFVQPDKDFGPAVMAAIRSQPGHSFQAPVVEMETAQSVTLLMPRTTNGHQRRPVSALSLKENNLLLHAHPLDRALAATLVVAVLAALGGIPGIALASGHVGAEAVPAWTTPPLELLSLGTSRIGSAAVSLLAAASAALLVFVNNRLQLQKQLPVLQ
jgi:hypothetical protein